MKKEKPIPAWAIAAARELDKKNWIHIYPRLSLEDVEQVARIIADAYDAPLEAAIRKHVKAFDKIMRGPASRERGQDLAEAIRILESNIK